MSDQGDLIKDKILSNDSSDSLGADQVSSIAKDNIPGANSIPTSLDQLKDIGLDNLPNHNDLIAKIPSLQSMPMVSDASDFIDFISTHGVSSMVSAGLASWVASNARLLNYLLNRVDDNSSIAESILIVFNHLVVLYRLAPRMKVITITLQQKLEMKLKRNK